MPRNPTKKTTVARELTQFASGLRENASEELEYADDDADDARDAAERLVEEAKQLEALAKQIAARRFDAARRAYANELDSDLRERLETFCPTAHAMLANVATLTPRERHARTKLYADVLARIESDASYGNATERAALDELFPNRKSDLDDVLAKLVREKRIWNVAPAGYDEYELRPEAE